MTSLSKTLGGSLLPLALGLLLVAAPAPAHQQPPAAPGAVQASPSPEGPQAGPGEWASAEATVKTTAPSNCRHSPMHREADGCTAGACTSAKNAVRAAMKQAIGAACEQYIVVKSTCQYGPGCKK